MGESVVVLQSYSFVAPLHHNDKSLEDNAINEISQSVSLGRFMTEDLEWGKWSCFSHKKYVDEAEKYSKPGSVAQKKAFFEAYYNKIALAKKAEASDLKQEPESVVVLLNTLETLTKDESDDETELVLSSEELVFSVEKDDELERQSGVVLEQEEESLVHEDEENHTEDEELLKKSSCTIEKEEESVVHDEIEDKENHTEDGELLKKSSYTAKEEEEEESLVHDEMEDRENHIEDGELLKKSSSAVEEEAKEEEGRRSATKNPSVVVLSMEKSEPMELVFTQKISERPETHSSIKRQEKSVRQRFSFLSCFMGNTKAQDQNTTTRNKRKTDKKPTKLFLCLCFKPKMVGETTCR